MPKMELPTRSVKKLIEMRVLLVAYAMSRLDTRFLEAYKYAYWKRAFSELGIRFGVPPASIKNLRDEFDPFHLNSRKGWHKRSLRPNRQRVLGEFCEVEDSVLLEITSRIIAGDGEADDLIVSPMAEKNLRIENVAERLRTGRFAEDYFTANSDTICGIPSTQLLDMRLDARGFDFAAKNRTDLAIEVKGLKETRGDILFTELEWRTAKERKDNFWLVIIGGIGKLPTAKLIINPAATISVKSTIRNSISLTWRATVNVSIKT